MIVSLALFSPVAESMFPLLLLIYKLYSMLCIYRYCVLYIHINIYCIVFCSVPLEIFILFSSSDYSYRYTASWHDRFPLFKPCWNSVGRRWLDRVDTIGTLLGRTTMDFCQDPFHTRSAVRLFHRTFPRLGYLLAMWADFCHAIISRNWRFVMLC